MSTSQETAPGHDDRAKPTNVVNTTPSATLFCHLPPDILYRIASKLSPKEFARTSILSTGWGGCTTSACPRLTFDFDAMMCKRSKCERTTEDCMHILLFVNEVNDILQKHNNKVVETLQVIIDFKGSIFLAHHIDTWVHFATTSGTKNLILDLRTQRFWEYMDMDLYVFPFQFLDRKSIARLQHMRLSFVSLDPPSHFKGFPNLRKLHLQTVLVNSKDLENMLSHCYTLEWLYIDRCRLDDELIVDSPLPRLLYLRVECCLTKIRFNAVNLATFEYEGSFIPIDLGQSFKLQAANITFSSAVFQHALGSLLNGLQTVQNLSFKIRYQILEKQWLWDGSLKFFNLRNLHLLLMYILHNDVDKILYSLAFLIRATPFIEKLEVHFAGRGLWLAQEGPCRKDLEHCKYAHLKHIRVTGFTAARGQLEFLLHVIENAPALEDLLVKIGHYSPYEKLDLSGSPIEKAKEILRTCMCPILSQNVTFEVKE